MRRRGPSGCWNRPSCDWNRMRVRLISGVRLHAVSKPSEHLPRAYSRIPVQLVDIDMEAAKMH